MSKKNDDSIEHFFQKAVSQQDNSHVDQDWRAMEKLLDDNQAAGITSEDKMPLPGRIIRNTIVVALIVSGWLFYGISEYSKSTSSAIKTPDVAKKNEVDLLTKKGNDEETSKQAVASVLGPQNQNSDRVAADLLASHSARSRKQVRPRATAKMNDALRSRVVDQQQTGLNIANQSGYENDQSDLASSLNSAPVSHHDSGEFPGQPSDHLALTSPPENIQAKLDTDHSENSIVEESAQSEAPDKKDQDQVDADEPGENEKKFVEKFPRWSVLLTVAPDFSSTKVGRYNSPGLAYGGLISFRPLRRLQISTGIFKASKQYEGYGDEYQPPYGYWERRTNGRVPDEVYGSCDILDWPILVRYDVFRLKRATIFLNGGISSYRMVDEKYDYTFATANPGAVSGWESHEPVDYSFSIGNISVGYERQLSPNISIQVEPYLKLPFKAIGWSNIDLHTTGVYFSVRYSFIKKRLPETLQPIVR